MPYAPDVVVAPDATFVASFASFLNHAEVAVIRNGAIGANVKLPTVADGSATWTGSELVTAWTEESDGGSLLRLARISATGDIRSVMTLARSRELAGGVAVAAANGQLLLAFGRNDPNTVYGNANRIQLTLDPMPRRRSTTH
ncbi:MAG: hypothetical protein JWO97_3782 [Acidobacteria bacterium]|nr:hypothetical protein [Acidobacteriota bacterium]